MDKEIPALYAIEYPPFTGFALTAFPVFFAEIPTSNHNRSSWQNRSQRPQTDWIVSIIFRKIRFQPPVVSQLIAFR